MTYRLLRREDDAPWEIVRDETGQEVLLNDVELQETVGMFMQRGIVCNLEYEGNPVFMTGMVDEHGKHQFNLFMTYEKT